MYSIPYDRWFIVIEFNNITYYRMVVGCPGLEPGTSRME